jgi:SAM-dependent methyltransferase
MSDSYHSVDTAAAEAYEEYMVPKIFGPWAQLVVDVVAPKPSDHILDVACGTGIAARLAANSVTASGRVAGLDIDPGMIAVARRLGRDAQVPVEWYCGSALDMPFEDHTFDLCFCLQGLQFFPDRVSGFSEIRRVLRPTGRLVATLWWPIEHNKGHYALAQSLERRGVDASAGRRPFSFGAANEIHETARRAGFREVNLRTEERLVRFPSVEAFVHCLASGAPSTRHALAKISKESLDQLIKDVMIVLEPYVTGGELAFPMKTHVVFARP